MEQSENFQNKSIVLSDAPDCSCPPWQLGTVFTEGGLVEGTNIRLGYRRHMDVFKGVPFAAIPGRFEKPRRHPGWEGELILDIILIS